MSTIYLFNAKKMKFLSNENLMLAYKNAKKSRKGKEEVYLWDYNLEENILKLKQDLETRNYKHGPYKKIILFDSKKRYIHSPCFRDHIVHHMLYNILYNVFDKKMIKQSYACRKGYGSHKTINYLQKLTFTSKSEFYLKLDISKYFYSVNHAKLKEIIFNHIKDESIRYVVGGVINSYKTGSQFDEILRDNLKYISNDKKGIPIGSIISQLFANFYLHKLDHFVKHDLKVKKYIRYMDDFILIGEKQVLSNAKKKIIDFVYSELDLFINPKKISFNSVFDGINFVGYKIKDNFVYVGKRTKNKTNKFLDELNQVDLTLFDKNFKNKLNNSLQSRLGVFKHSSFGLNYFNSRGNIVSSSWG